MFEKMKNDNLVFIWCIGWWLEDDKAWCIDGIHNMIFCIDLDTGQCEKVSSIPNLGESPYRLNPFCIKCNRDIFCLPGYGNNIWIYNLDNKNFMKINIDKPKEQYLASQFWRLGDSLYIVGGTWNKVIEVSISQKAIKHYYEFSENDSIMRSVLVGNNIYAVSTESSRIYQFDIMTKKVQTYSFPNLQKKFFNICFDGKKFWMSGYQKELYVWDKEKGSITILTCFPEGFEDKYANRKIGSAIGNDGLQVFERSVVVGDTVWFLPTHGGKIVYADRETFELSVFEINDEDEMMVISNKMYEIVDYLFEYVKDNRYIGVFSAKSKRIFEIDTKQLSYKWMEYYFCDECLKQLSEDLNGIFYERNGDLFYIQACGREINMADSKKNDVDVNSIGMKIYTKIAREDM